MRHYNEDISSRLDQLAKHQGLVFTDDVPRPGTAAATAIERKAANQDSEESGSSTSSTPMGKSAAQPEEVRGEGGNDR